MGGGLTRLEDPTPLAAAPSPGCGSFLLGLTKAPVSPERRTG